MTSIRKKIRNRRYAVTGLLAVLSLTSSTIWAQQTDEDTQTDTTADLSTDLLDRGTPRRSMRGYLEATVDRDYDRAAAFMDLRNLPRGLGEADGPRLAEDLDIVLQRYLWIDLQSLSDDPEGWSGDGLPEYRDYVGNLETSRGEIALMMQRVPGENDTRIWKVSNATVAIIPDLYVELGYPRWVESFRRSFPDGRFLGFELFKWAIAIFVGLVVYGTGRALCFIGVRLLPVKESHTAERITRFLTRPLLIFIVITSMNYAGDSLGTGFEAQQSVLASDPIWTALLMWLMLATFGLGRDLYARRLTEHGRAGSLVLLRPLTAAAQVVVAVTIALMWLDNAGYSITTLLAGLGVGGLAVALVLQKPLEDVFGAVSLYSQRPVRLGDFCRIGDITGTVEQIGLRSTRIRTLENTIVAIPNAKVAGEHIDNFSMRQKIWYHPILRLRYDTTSEQLRKVVDRVQSLLEEHPRVISEDATVRLVGFGKYGIEVGVRAYLSTTTYAEFLAIAEDLNFAVMDIVTACGSSFAVPPDWQLPSATMDIATPYSHREN